jgi:hypothetical protein
VKLTTSPFFVFDKASDETMDIYLPANIFDGILHNKNKYDVLDTRQKSNAG